ncbi:MAG: hypothetical protein ABR579_10250 [Actinomycetota bacterium]
MRATAVVAALVVVLGAGCGSDKSGAGPKVPAAAPTAAVTPLSEKTPAQGKGGSSHKPQVLQMPDGVPMAGGVQYSTSKFAVEIHFVEPDGMAYPFAADTDSPTFVDIETDDTGGVLFLAPQKLYTSSGKLDKAPSDLLSALKSNDLLTVSGESPVAVGGVHGMQAQVAAKTIPHAKWAFCGDTACVPVMEVQSGPPYGILKGITYTYYFLTVGGRRIIISIEGNSGSGYKTFYQNALKLVKTIKFASK